MSGDRAEIVRYVRGLEASATQLSTALHWLADSLAVEAGEGRAIGQTSAVHLCGPVRALSMAILNLNDGVAGLLRSTEQDLRKEALKAGVVESGEAVH